MFSENEIKAYKSIKAPDSLKERVMSVDKKVIPFKKTVYKQIAALAATIVLIISIGFVGIKMSAPQIYTGGTEYNGGKVYLLQEDIALARSTSKNLNIIEINSLLPVDISVDNGSFTVGSFNTEKNNFSVKKYSGKGNISIIVDVNDGETAVLTVSGLFYDEKIELVAE